MERIPILRMGNYLLVTIQVDMHDRLAMQLQEDLTTRIAKDQARGVPIDISALDIVDSFIGRMLSDIAGMSRVLDAQTVVVGMQPAAVHPAVPDRGALRGQPRGDPLAPSSRPPAQRILLRRASAIQRSSLPTAQPKSERRFLRRRRFRSAPLRES